MILVTGATGATGGAAARALLAAGQRPRVLVRNAERARDLEAAGAELAIGAIVDRPALESALEGVDRMYLMSPVGPELIAQEVQLLDAAVSADVRAVVRLSVIDVDPHSPVRFLRDHAAGDAALEAAGIPYVTLHPNDFMQNWFNTLQGEMAFVSPADVPIASIDTRDVGEVAAAVLLDPDRHIGNAYTLTGPEALTRREQAAILGEALGREINVVGLEPEQLEQGMIQGGLPEWIAGGLRELSELYATGALGRTTTTVQELLGRPPRSFAEFARDHAGAFS